MTTDWPRAEPSIDADVMMEVTISAAC